MCHHKGVRAAPSVLPCGATLGILLALGGCYFDFTAGGDAGERADGPALSDAGVAVDAAPAVDAFVPFDGSYALLSETGLFEDIASQTVADDIREFEPLYKLWSDGATKTRYIYLPPGSEIDTSDMDHWRFPPGTKMWKTFAEESPSGRILLETRLIERRGTAPVHNYMMSFRWRPECFDDNLANDGECDADAAPGNTPEERAFNTNVNGTEHDIPRSPVECMSCHAGEPHQFLGFSAIQLSHPSAPETCALNPGGRCPTIDSLASEGRLTTEVPEGGFPVPGGAITRRALGYLHANCGGCHQPPSNSLVLNGCYTDTGNVPSKDLEGFHTRIYAADSGGSPQATATWRTLFGVDGCGHPLLRWNGATNPSCEPLGGGEFDCAIDRRAVPGATQKSAVLYRMGSRALGEKMPFLGTEVADAVGMGLVESFINSVSRPASCPK